METLIKHLISIAWRLSAGFLVVIAAIAVYNTTGFALDIYSLLISCIVAGEITKWMNVTITGKKEVTFLAKKTVAKKKKK